MPRVYPPERRRIIAWVYDQFCSQSYKTMTQCVYRGVAYKPYTMDAGLIQYFMNKKAKQKARAKELERDQAQHNKELIV